MPAVHSPIEWWAGQVMDNQTDWSVLVVEWACTLCWKKGAGLRLCSESGVGCWLTGRRTETQSWYQTDQRTC